MAHRAAAPVSGTGYRTPEQACMHRLVKDTTPTVRLSFRFQYGCLIKFVFNSMIPRATIALASYPMLQLDDA